MKLPQIILYLSENCFDFSSEQKQVHLKKKENGKGYASEIQIFSGHKKYTAKLLTCLIRAFGDKMILAAFYKLLHDILLFASPVLLKWVTFLSFFLFQSEFPIQFSI